MCAYVCVHMQLWMSVCFSLSGRYVRAGWRWFSPQAATGRSRHIFARASIILVGARHCQKPSRWCGSTKHNFDHLLLPPYSWALLPQRHNPIPVAFDMADPASPHNPADVPPNSWPATADAVVNGDAAPTVSIPDIEMKDDPPTASVSQGPEQ
jgi:hypothetical protein